MAESYTITQYQRDATVNERVIQQAKGKYESGAQQASFKDLDGIPFFEVHHVGHLADNGADSATNALPYVPIAVEKPNMVKTLKYLLSNSMQV